MTGEAGTTQRFSWRLHVEDSDGDADPLDLDGGATDASDLRHALTEAAAQVARRFAEPAGGADDEDGWELRAPTESAPRAAPKARRS